MAGCIASPVSGDTIWQMMLCSSAMGFLWWAIPFNRLSWAGCSKIQHTDVSTLITMTRWRWRDKIVDQLHMATLKDHLVECVLVNICSSSVGILPQPTQKRSITASLSQLTTQADVIYIATMPHLKQHTIVVVVKNKGNPYLKQTLDLKLMPVKGSQPAMT